MPTWRCSPGNIPAAIIGTTQIYASTNQTTPGSRIVRGMDGALAAIGSGLELDVFSNRCRRRSGPCGRMRCSAFGPANIVRQLAHDALRLQRLGRPLFDIETRHAGVAIAEWALQRPGGPVGHPSAAPAQPHRVPIDPRGVHSVPYTPGRRKVPRARDARKRIRGWLKLRRDPRGLDRDGRGDVDRVHGLKPRRKPLARQQPSACSASSSASVDLQHPPVGVRIVSTRAVPKSTAAGSRNRTGPMMAGFLGRVAAALDEPLRLPGLNREGRTAAQHPGPFLDARYRRLRFRAPVQRRALGPARVSVTSIWQSLSGCR